MMSQNATPPSTADGLAVRPARHDVAMTDLDHGRLARIAATLPADDAAFLHALADRLDPPWQRRARRLAARDEAVRLALLACSDLRPCRAAAVLASELRRMVTTPHAQGERAALLRRILTLSGGRALAWRRIVDIAEAQDLQ